MLYYDLDSSWTVNVSVRDNSNELAYNDTVTFSYGQLQAIRGNKDGITFGSLNLGETANATNDPLVLDNTGNQNFTEINITAYDLVGQSTPLEYIGALNFYVNATADNFGDQLVNNTQLVITSATLPRDIGGIDTNVSLYFWVIVPGSGLTAQDYISTIDWIIDAFT
jgi:hypothetical protein